MPGLSTVSVHGSDALHRVRDVAPPINISTTFKYAENPAHLKKACDIESHHDLDTIYSRHSHPNGIYVEETVGKITNSYAVAYTSGSSAFFALLTYLNPKRLFLGPGYGGTPELADIFTRNYGLVQYSLSEADLAFLQPGDVVHLETPLNPSALCIDIQRYAEIAHAKGAYVSVDSTFAPIQDPFAFGADFVMHSATKYFGGHSDVMAGLLLTKSRDVKKYLLNDRLSLGTNIATLEAALLFRSLKTFEMRVQKQSENAGKIVKFLAENKHQLPGLAEVTHSSLQKEDFVHKQLQGFQPPTFSISLESEQLARVFPSRLKIFYHATSLGGVESLIEWRAIVDDKAPPTLLRLSIGVENADDLIEDLRQAFASLGQK